MFVITITEPFVDDEGTQQAIERYRQTVDTIDMRALINLVNAPPRKERAPRADKGVKRTAKETAMLERNSV